jgi:hypothetical protein
MNNKLLYTVGYITILVVAKVVEALASQALESTLTPKVKLTNTRQG